MFFTYGFKLIKGKLKESKVNNADLQEEAYKILKNCIEQKILQFENNNNTLAIN